MERIGMDIGQDGAHEGTNRSKEKSERIKAVK
jgi:hypothetical protein